MAITTYSELQSAVASWLHRSDLTSEIKDFIALAEADLQVRAKLAQWDTTATVTIASGSGPLPSDFDKAIAVKYGTQQGTLQFLSLPHFSDYLAKNPTGEPLAYGIRGSNLLVAPSASGDATLTYTARFLALSDSATTNALLALFPDAYLHGALVHAGAWLQDDRLVGVNAPLFDAALNRIKTYMLDRKYPQGLQVRAV